LHLLLAHEDSVDLVGEASTNDELVHVLESQQVDVLLVDWALPGWSPERLSGHLSGVRVVGLGGRPEWRGRILAGGAHAFVSKLDAPDGLLQALRASQPRDQD